MRREENMNNEKMDMETVDGCLVLKGPGELDFDYGYEYIGDSVDYFMCPQMEKSVVCLYENICRNSDDWRAVLVNGQENVRIGPLILQLANACGMGLAKTSFDSQTQYQ
jgi:hypothetical protein